MGVDAVSLHVVVVNYRTAALTIDCLASLASEVQAIPGLQVKVVDNASPDASAIAIARAIATHGWGEWARLIYSPFNGGFASGNNIAIRQTLRGAEPPDYFWLLNPDTRVVPGAARVLLDFMHQHPEAGIAGSALIEANGACWPYAFRFPSILSEVERGIRLGPITRLLSDAMVLRRMGPSPTPVDWLPGASMMVRRAVFETVGLMDENYFLYFEETDFCLAARRAGWQSWYVPQAEVVHIAGQSTGLTGSQPAAGRVPRYWFESRRRYFTKNHGRAYALAADLAWAAAHIAWCMLRWARKGAADPPGLLADFLRVSAAAAWRAQR